MQIPRSVKDIDAGWLSEALREGGALPGGSVASVEIEVIGEGVGFAGELARLSAVYEDGVDSGPATMIAKLPTSAPEARALFLMAGIYAAEGAFYRDLAALVPLRTPRCYFNGMAPATGEFVLLLEDLAPARVGDQAQPCSREDAETIVRELARLHSAFWGSPEIEGLEWLSAAAQRDLTPLLPFVWPAAEERAGDLMSPKVRTMAASLPQSLPGATRLLSSTPVTLTHGDYRLDNMFFDLPGEGGELAVVDWQAVSRQRGPADLAYFMTGSLAVEDRRAWADDLVDLYMTGLRNGGVEGYTEEVCRRDMAAGLVEQLARTVLLMSGADLSIEGRGQVLALSLLERTNAIFEDTDFGVLQA